MSAVLWFRRDLRLQDHPALLRAVEEGEQVTCLFVLDPRLTTRRTPRVERLFASLAALNVQLGGRLVVRTGRASEVVPQVATETKATTVHVSRETTPYGRRRDVAVAAALERMGARLVVTGSPYAVGPGTLLTGSGTPYQVFTPFSKAWRAHGFPSPAGTLTEAPWTSLAGEEIPEPATSSAHHLDCAGELAALERWTSFRDNDIDNYRDERDRPDLDTTSRLSTALKFGEIHPRTLLASMDDASPGTSSEGVAAFVTELAWREFYADVLWHHPRSAWADLRPALAAMSYDDPAHPDVASDVSAWREGQTGFPIVDAGMRQLLEQGWMHNRLRMITASFLVKDLHVWWPVGARHFLDHLTDGDVASNNHGWQWVAGTGTDAAPYFRIFNPVTQGKRFDPDGTYVRRFVPELRHLPGAAAHEPWKHPEGYAQGYPPRVVDHDEERRESLRRYDAARA